MSERVSESSAHSLNEQAGESEQAQGLSSLLSKRVERLRALLSCIYADGLSTVEAAWFGLCGLATLEAA